ncbi:MAG: bifunctional diguanylate cyclase/phosphodiesterase, partial [Acidimicrobiales bacterium]|nr:bifunctional diguanylate cyclase/phosphodiesterase [Acidimicrobiales bacterium]
GGGSPARPANWGVLAATILTYEVVTDLGVARVVYVSGGKPDRQYFSHLGLQILTVAPVNSAIGIVAVALGWTDAWALLLLAGPGVGLAMWYRSANGLRTRFNDLTALYGFTVKLADVADGAEVLAVALREAQSILHCERAELSVPEPEGAFRYRLDVNDRLSGERVDLPAFERGIIATRMPVFLPRGHRDVSVADRGFDDLMAVPVAIGDEKTAVLIAADRQGESTTFAKEDLRLFEALAAHLGTALTSSRRLDRLRHEVAAREHEAFHDSLTGLANRKLFTQVLTTALKRRKPSHRVAVMIMDLDGFKEINDTLGHHTGDAILKVIGERVGEAVGPNRLASRLGGDEFAFVIAAAASVEDVLATANDILEAVSAPISVGGMNLSLRASIGISLAPLHGSDPSSLLKRADVAMYSSKSTSRRVTVYDPEIDRSSTRRLVLASDLRNAIAAEELEVWYQPVARIHDGSICGFEALLRWRHPEYGPVSPDEFIPVAEQTGLIETLTWWVLREALEQLRKWRDSGFDLSVSVNVSARSLLDAEIVDRLARIITSTGVPKDSLTLEITESSIMIDPDRSERILNGLSDLGVRIAIDDFGTGYSSLSRLKALPVQLVKIDRSFVQRMCADNGDEAIVRTTIELARNMGHTVVAEGVEDRETWDQLAMLGCDEAQGYFLSAAMPADQARDWLRDHQAPSLAPVRRLVRLAEGA